MTATMGLQRHPAAAPENIRRLIKAQGLAALAARLRVSQGSLADWAESKVMPSVQNQKKLARLYLEAHPEDAPALREMLADNLRWAEVALDNALHERTSPRDESHKPARRNFLIAQIHLRELDQLVRERKSGAAEPPPEIDPEIADLYGD